MTVITSQTVKYYKNFFGLLKVHVKTPMGCASKFSSYMTMIYNFFIAIINKFFTNSAPVISTNFAEINILFPTYDQIFVKAFFHYFFAVLILFKNWFNKIISSLFTSKNNNWLTKSVIHTNNFVSKTTGNVILIFFV